MDRAKIVQQILHPLVILIGAQGAFPRVPYVFQVLGRAELFQYLLVFLLAYQGGGQRDIARALMVTVSWFLLTKIFNLRSLIAQVQMPPERTEEGFCGHRGHA